MKELCQEGLHEGARQALERAWSELGNAHRLSGAAKVTIGPCAISLLVHLVKRSHVRAHELRIASA